jgi:glyoxylase-like metal-dependent hydrolase (beta-lactamase superfamily II)
MILFLAGCGPSASPPLPEAPLARLTERVYVIHGPNERPNPANRGFMNNPGFVVTDKGVVVVDPGSSVAVGEMVLKKIAEVTSLPVIAVFDTHIHGDHWLGNQAIKAAFPQAVIYAHPNMKAKAPTEGENWVALLDRLTEGAIAGTRPVVPDMHIDGGETLALGGLHFRIHHTGPAHTDGDIMIEVVEEKVLFLGDIALAGRIGRMDDGRFRGNLAALDAALATAAIHFIPGHGPSGGRQVVEDYRRYLATLYDAVKSYYERGLSDFEMKPKVAERLAAFRSWRDFEAELGRQVSLAYLEIEAETF